MSTTKVKLGTTGPEVFPLGLGCAGFSGTYGATSDAESLATVQAALDAGVTLLDTADFYGMGHNELLLGRAIAGRRDQVTLSVKFGGLRSPEGAFIGFDLRPAAVKNFAAYSLRRLGVDCIDIYRPARLDPGVPIEDTIGAIADLIKAGHVRHIGLSEVGIDTVRRAAKVHPIVDLQTEYALATRGPETSLFPALHEMGLSATLYGVLSRGLLSGSTSQGPGDWRSHLPRFAPENRAQNEAAVAALGRFAAARGVTTTELAFAWVRAMQPGFVALVGARTRAQIATARRALDLDLSADDLAELDRLVPPGSFAGTRYPAAQMAHLPEGG